jgi:hypothetical protein
MFYKDSNSQDGFSYICKLCRFEYDRNHYSKKRDIILKKNKEWRENNKEHTKYYKKNIIDQDEKRLQGRIYKAKISKEMSNKYIKDLIIGKKKDVRDLLIPDELIETKRLQLTLLRFIKEKQNEQQHRMANNPLLPSLP